MKKSLSLLAILGLLTISLMTSASALAPLFNDIPDLKLTIGTGLTPAFDLACFNSQDAATTYAITVNFAGKSSLSGSTVSEGSWASATIGNNSYSASNDGGTGTASNKVKWSTFLINKLPKVGLTVGNSWSVNVGTKVSPSLPGSFGSANALIVSDTTKVTAAWTNSSVVNITLIAAATGPVNVDVIASASSTPFSTVDFDKERIQVYTNLMASGTFATSGDTAAYAYQAPAGYTVGAVGYAASVADGNGLSANGVLTLGATGNTSGYKITPTANLTYNKGSWYIARARAFSPDASNTHQFQVFNYNGLAGTSHTDIAANIYFGVSNAWTWYDTPLLARATSSNGFVQLFFKAGGAGTLNIDELQVIQSAPTLVDASRGCTKLRYAYGTFSNASDAVNGYGIQALAAPVAGTGTLTVTGGKLTVDMSAASGSNILGFKATATNNAAGIYTPASTVGKEAGVKADYAIQSGSFNTINSLILVAIYGVNSVGGTTDVTNAQLIATAEFQGLTGGTYTAAGLVKNPYQQFQFQAKSDNAGVLTVDNVDYLSDNDDPNYGDQALFN